MNMARMARNTLIVLAVLTGLYLLWLLRSAALLFVGSLAIAASLRPAISRLTRRGLPRPVAIGGVYLLVFGALTIGLFFAGGGALEEIQRLTDDFVETYRTMFDEWREGSRAQRAIAARLPAPDDFFNALAAEPGAAMLQSFLGATFSLLALSIDLVIALFLSVYWSIDQIHFERLWLSLLPLERRASARQLWQSVESEVGAYLRSELVQSLAAGLLLWIGYRALGERYPVLLALIGATIWLVPWIGALLAAVAVVLLSLPMLVLEHPFSLSIVSLSLAHTLLVLLALEFFVEPRFFNRRRYNSLITAVVIFGMAEVAGWLGILLGAPLAAAIQIAGGQWMRLRLEHAGNGASALAYDERMASLRDELARTSQPGKEVASLVDRLSEIVDQAEQVLDGDLCK